MSSHKYSKGSNVSYNSAYYTVFRHRDVNGSPGYLLRKIVDGTVVDNVLESACSDCDCSAIINTLWPNFTYTGDNGAASNWIMNNLIKNMHCCENVNYGHNSDSSVYTFSCDDGTWTKNKS